MVKPDTHMPATKQDEADGASLTARLRQETMPLFHNGRLVRKNVLSPLEIVDKALMADLLLLPVNAPVAVLTEETGRTALEIAQMRPHWSVTGWVQDTKSFLRLQTVATPENLVFDKMPRHIASAAHAPQAIIATGWAHRVLSASRYQLASLLQGVRELLELLPENGQLLLQDFALPDDHEAFVTLDIENEAAARELLEFSARARPDMAKPLQGFFVEILPSPRAGVQRFHLPCKWAVEFFHRWRTGIASDAPFELTTLSTTQWSALVEQCGGRALYRAPHELTRHESRELHRVMRFRDAQGNEMPLPATGFSLLVEKIPEQAPLAVYERRVSALETQDIRIATLQGKPQDKTQDNSQDNPQDDAQEAEIVELRHHEDDVLPWYRDAEKRLHVLVRSHVPRPVINAVPRGTPNLDGRYWAGYLVEPLAMPAQKNTPDPEIVAAWLRGYMPPDALRIGPVTEAIAYYPAPDYLAQRVRGLLVPVQPQQLPMRFSLEQYGTGQSGQLIDVLADDVLRAISAGLIPDGKLEILIARLMIELGIQPAENDYLHGQTDMQRGLRSIKDKREVRTPRTVKSGDHFENFITDTPPQQRRAVRSLFVEEQITATGREIAHMSEHEFIVPSTLTANSAVCIPVAVDPMGRFLVSSEPRRLPVPARMGHQGELLQLPTFSLPATVRNLDQARLFLARQLHCDAEDIYVMGPGFFVHPQISPERVYPFLVNASAYNARWMRWFKPVSRCLRRMVRPEAEKTAAYIEFKAARDMGEWYTGFTPDLTTPAQTGKASVPVDDTLAQLARHPMVLPRPE